MQIITIANQKGGTAKSTTAAALAQAAAHRGRRVLAVDLDPQGNLSYFLAADVNRPGAFEVLDGQPAAEAIQTTRDAQEGRPAAEAPAGRLDVIPASWNLQTISSGKGSARRLMAALEPIKGRYDLIIIDTPPTAGELQYNALMAATDLIIPLQADIVGLQGLDQMADTARQIQQTNRALAIRGCILTRSGGRSTLARQMAAATEARAREMGIPLLLAIREAVAIREAQTLQRDLYEYAPRSKPALDYMELLNRITGENRNQ